MCRETARRINEKIVDHTSRCTNSHLLIYSMESGYKPYEVIDYKIIGKGYRENNIKRKLPEALIIKELKPIPNKQEGTVSSKMFNKHCLLTYFDIYVS